MHTQLWPKLPSIWQPVTASCASVEAGFTIAKLECSRAVTGLDRPKCAIPSGIIAPWEYSHLIHNVRGRGRSLFLISTSYAVSEKTKLRSSKQCIFCHFSNRQFFQYREISTSSSSYNLISRSYFQDKLLRLQFHCKDVVSFVTSTKQNWSLE